MDFSQLTIAVLAVLALGASPANSQTANARPQAENTSRHLVDLSVEDEFGNDPPQILGGVIDSDASIKADPEAFWGGRGIWKDTENYCEDLLGFLSASTKLGNFRYADTHERVSFETLTNHQRFVEGDYFIKTDPNSPALPCSVSNVSQQGYYGIACVKVVSYSRPDIFMSVYNQTLKDIKECLIPVGWKQISADNDVCDAGERGVDKCIQTFINKSRALWLFSHIVGGVYALGVQTNLGD